MFIMEIRYAYEDLWQLLNELVKKIEFPGVAADNIATKGVSSYLISFILVSSFSASSINRAWMNTIKVKDIMNIHSSMIVRQGLRWRESHEL